MQTTMPKADRLGETALEALCTLDFEDRPMHPKQLMPKERCEKREHSAYQIVVRGFAIRKKNGDLEITQLGRAYLDQPAENVEVLVPKKGMVTIPTVPPEGKFWLLNSLEEIVVE